MLRELIVYDDEKDVFQTLKAIDLKSPLRLSGHPFRQSVDGVEYLYCGESVFPNVRVKAEWREDDRVLQQLGLGPK